MTSRIAIWFLSGLFVVLWSSGFIGAKYGLSDAGTFTLLWWRYLIVVAVLVVLATAFRHWRRMDLPTLCQHAVIGIMAHAVWLVAVLLAIDLNVAPGTAAFITALQPMITGLLAGLIVEERLVWRQWVGVALGIFAVALVIGDKARLDGSVAAHLLPFLAALGISLASVFDRRMRSARTQRVEAPILMTTSIHAGASLLVLTPFAWGLEGFQANVTEQFVFSVVWLALIVSLAAYGLMFLLLRSVEATKVSSLMYLSPPVTMVLAYLAFGTVLTIGDIVGLAVAAVAVAMVTYSPGALKPARTADRSA